MSRQKRQEGADPVDPVDTSLARVADAARQAGGALLAQLHDPKRAAELARLTSSQALADAASAAASVEPLGGRYIKTEGGTFTWAGTDLGTSLRCVVVASCFVNAHHAERYRPGQKNANTAPDCFAFGSRLGDMVPAGNPGKPICVRCNSPDGTPLCKLNQFGSADEGEGKACSNTKRLVILPIEADGPSASALAGELLVLHVPPTSVKTWGGYVQAVARDLAVPPWCVVTDVQIVAGTRATGRKAGGFSLAFARVQPVPDDLRQLVALRLAGAAEVLLAPYPAPRKAVPKAKRAAKQAAKK